MNGTLPDYGTGQWSTMYGGGQFADANDVYTLVTNIPANENITIHHIKTNGLTFLDIQESDIESAFHLEVIASISLFCWSNINCWSLILSSTGAGDFVISAIASCGDVTPFNTLAKVGFTTDAAPNNNLPTVVSLNSFLFCISFFFPR